jgi:hypothetical protein
MWRNAVICLTEVVFVSECANIIITHDCILAFVSLIEFSQYCHILYPVANMAVTEIADAVTNVHEAELKM